MRNLVVWAISMGAAFYGGSKAYLHSEVEDTMDMAVMLMSPYADVEYKGVRSTMSGELTIEDVRIRIHEFRDEIVIDRMGIDTPSFFSLLDMSDYLTMQDNDVPDYFGILVEGVHVPVEADFFDELYAFGLRAQHGDDEIDAAAQCTGKYGFSPAALKALGYHEQVFSFAMTARNDDGQYVFEVETDIEDMWEADARMTMAGDMMSELALGTAYRPRLRNLTIDYTDKSLKQRVTKYCAKLGLSHDEILQAQMDTFRFYGESNGIEFDEYMLDPYLEFLKGASRITITAKPNEPIAMSQIDLYKPSDVPALLNLEAQVR